LLRATLLLLIIAIPTWATAHPLHTTITELTYDSRSGVVTLLIRAFADDFGAAIALSTRDAREPRRTVRYLAQRLELRGSDDRLVVLHWAGMKRTEDVVWIRLEGRAPAGVRGGTLRHGVLLDMFSDQVNILKVRYGRVERTLLFTRGAERKRLP
jgi:hypothetical protein